MERYTMFLDWKNQHCENEYTTQSNLQNQCNPYQITNGIFFFQKQNKNFFFLVNVAYFYFFNLILFIFYTAGSYQSSILYTSLYTCRFQSHNSSHKICRETQNTQNSQSSFEGKKMELEESDSLTSDYSTKLQ